MKTLILIALLTIAAHAQETLATTIKIPADLHYRHEYVPAHEKAKTQAFVHQQLSKLAPLKEKQVRNLLESKGWNVDSVHVDDVQSYLVFNCVVHHNDHLFYRLFLDPTTAEIVSTYAVNKFN